MSPSVKLFLLLMFCSVYHLGRSDKEYEVINFKVPQGLWRQAFNPTPVLKSGVTITLPVSVQDESENELDDEIEDVVTLEPVVETSPETPEGNITQIQQDEVPAVSSTPAPAVTQAPVQQETGEPAQDVPGQVTRFPCACRQRQCGCCTGALLDRFQMKACGNISFIPEDFVFDVRMSINDRTVVRQRVSASDPPPICFNPRRAPFVRVCAEISNIRIRNRNAHACLDINADIGGFPVYTASFRCFSFGTSGLQTGLKPKPVSSGPKPVNLFGSGNSNADDEGGFLENAASAVFGGGGGSSDNDGPFDAIGDAIGDFFDGE